MLNYTEQLWRLMHDVVRHVPKLSFIDTQELFVFARHGRTGADGAFATCHSLTLPESEPGYYFWRDRATGSLTRRSEWFVTKTPEVRIEGNRIKYLISFVLPRFCEQTLAHSRKAEFYAANTEPWIAKLDTVVHELYHIDPQAEGLRKFLAADGKRVERSHGPGFYEQVAEMVQLYLASQPDARRYEFLKYDFSGLRARHGTVVCTTFRNFPSFPQRYIEPLSEQPPEPVAADLPVEPIRRCSQPSLYTEQDVAFREFTGSGTRRHARPVPEIGAAGRTPFSNPEILH
ncbi:MAG: hypothetical protein ACM36C_13505 [Acidobacteriota bacterium]